MKVEKFVGPSIEQCECTVFGLAQRLYDHQSQDSLERRMLMLLHARARDPRMKSLKVYPAIELALQWKELDRKRTYLVN